MGLGLHVPNVEMGEQASIIATDGFVEGINRYRQYFAERDGVYLGPRPGEIVFDSGAYIGDVATGFAMHVGSAGQIHMFDPMPTHVDFCNQQKALNSHLTCRMHVVPMQSERHAMGPPNW